MAVDTNTVLLLEALTRRYHDVLVHLADMASTTVQSMWDDLGGVTDAAQRAFARRASDFVTRTQMAMARATVTYIDTYVNVALGERQRVAAVDIAALVAEARRGIPSIDVYMRPAVTARKALADGKNIADALRIARGRAASAANTDVALAARRGAHDAMARHTQIVGYRRVPNADACVFCLVASTQRYHTGDLMPLHNNCRCAIAPIIGEIDPGQVINKDLLDSYKRGDVRDVISTHVHGELGPVLTRAGDAFAGLGAVQ